MLLAALRDTGYTVVLFLHVLTVIVAMTGAVAHPTMLAFEERRPDGDLPALARRFAAPTRIYAISYALTGIIGFALVSMGDWPWGDAWIWISIVLWLVSNALLHALMLPAERALAEGDLDALTTLKKVGPIISILVLLVIFLMTVKPDSSFY